MDEDAVNRLANRYKGKKKLSGNRLNVSVDAAMAPYFKPKPAPMDEFRKSRASTGTYQQESLDMVVARTLGLPPTRSRLGSQVRRNSCGTSPPLFTGLQLCPGSRSKACWA